MSQKIFKQKKKRKPRTVAPRTIGGRVMLTKPAAAAQLGYHPASLDRLLREGKLKLKKYYLVEGGMPRFAEDEVEALKRQGGAS